MSKKIKKISCILGVLIVLGSVVFFSKSANAKEVKSSKHIIVRLSSDTGNLPPVLP